MGGFTPTQEDLAKISASQDNNKMAEKKRKKIGWREDNLLKGGSGRNSDKVAG